MNDMMGMTVHQLRIRYTHISGFRVGEWATVLNVVLVQPSPYFPSRLCYAAQYPDGAVNYIPMEDKGNFELGKIE